MDSQWAELLSRMASNALRDACCCSACLATTSSSRWSSALPLAPSLGLASEASKTAASSPAAGRSAARFISEHAGLAEGEGGGGGGGGAGCASEGKVRGGRAGKIV
ncbi:unnamed protein product [Chondrus crispus]|uniref:Uncharacterized protein n=1 Tax=Chondrus crispus TaxID=2769 RepID=R7QGJ2_CHOCR|nr:unnamed protein product [Chondrus crispus]CDF37637.1 unnamed protein product [Chondrus crispus]|eukprot:XP_005717508.1 unnamed protein product [Chondrus crispus]